MQGLSYVRIASLEVLRESWVGASKGQTAS